MNTYRMRRIKTGLRKIMGLQPLYAVVAFGRGTQSIYDPSIPGNVWVQIQYANGLGEPYSVGGPAGTSVQLVVGTWVELQPTSNGRLKIVNYNVQANTAAGTDTLAANTPQLQSGGYVGQQSIITALVCPQQTPDLTVIIKAWVAIVAGTRYAYPGTPSGGFDLSGSVPSTGNNLIAVVFVNSDYATPSVGVSTARATSDLPLGDADIQEALTAGLVANPGATPLAAIRLYGGQTQIMQSNFVEDERQLINNTQASGTGDVTGPATSTNHAAVRWDGTTGEILADSGVIIDNSNNVTIPGIETTQGGKVRKTRVVTAAGAVTVATSDDIVSIDKTSGAATVVNLPATPTTGQTFVIHDGKGDAATHNITITPAAGNINGASTLVLNIAYASAICTYNGTQWDATIAETGSAGTGDVVGPASAVDSDFAQFDTTTGKLIKDGGLSLSTDGTFAANSDSLIPSQKAAKTYTDNAVQNAINGLAPKADLALWTAAALPAVTYSNGSSGVGATLVAVSTGVLTVDGVAVTLGMRIGVKDQVAQLQNGIYVVTTAGALGVAFVLTRTTDANTSAELLGAYAFALQGTVNADTAFLCSNSSAITIGTDAITFVKFQGAGINQLTGGGTAGPGTGSQPLTLPAKFLLQTADSNVPNAQAMGALGTGLVKNTTSTGVQSIAAAGTDYTSPTGTENLSNKTITASSLIATALSLLIGGFKAIFSHANSADRTYTFPDVTGNVLIDTATQNASNKTITASSLNSTPIGASSASTAIFSALSLLIGGFKAIFTHANTADRTYTLRDETGTLQMQRLTTKGDLLTFGTTDVRLAVGSDSQGLIANSTKTPGSYWRDLLYPKNFLINGGFELYSRQAITPSGVVSYSDGAYSGADLWYVLTQTASVQDARASSSLATNSAFAGDLIQNQASAQRLGRAQVLEFAESVKLRGRTINFQFQAKLDNGQALRYAILEWTGTADTPTKDVVNDWTSGTYTAGNFFLGSNLTVTAVGATTLTTNVWTQCNLSGTISTSCNNLIVFVWVEQTYAQNKSFLLAQAMLVDGADQVPWLISDPAVEANRAGRFLQTYYSASGSKTKIAMGHQALSSTGVASLFPYVPFRVTPALTATGSDWQSYASNTFVDVTAISLSANATAVDIEFNITAGQTVGVHIFLTGDSSADRYLILSAEL